MSTGRAGGPGTGGDLPELQDLLDRGADPLLRVHDGDGGEVHDVGDVAPALEDVDGLPHPEEHGPNRLGARPFTRRTASARVIPFRRRARKYASM